MKLLFVRPKKPKPFSELIMWWLDTDYSHTGLLFELEGNLVVFHSNYKGSHPLLLEDFLKEYDIIHEKTLEGYNREYALNYSLKKSTNKYSYLSIIAIPLGIKYGDGSRRMICSEYNARALNLKFKHIDTLTPRDLFYLV